MSSRRTSHSEEAHQPPGARARTGSASSARSGGSGSKVVTASIAPTTSSPLAPNVSCHYRYNGCYLLVIISDGCDMLRQEQLCQALKLNAARSDGTPSEPPADLASQLDALDAEWNRKFIEHTTQRIAKGLLSWNSTQTKCDLKPLEAFLESSLLHLTQPSSNGQESENSEMILQYAQDSLAVEVLLNPTLFTLTQCLRNVLRSPTGAVHVIYAGASFEETGSWILQDGSFSAYNFYELVQTEEKMASHSRPSTATTLSVAQGDTCKGHSSIAEHLSAHDIVLHFHSERSGEWAALSNIFSSHQFEPISNSMTSSLIMAELNGSGSSGGGKVRRESPTKRRRHLFHFDLNPADSPDGVQGAAALIDYLGEKLGKYYSSRGTVSQARFGTSADSALVDSVGYIRLDRPTLYVFPGGQGDCALFGLDNGFTMLIDGGFLPGQKSYWNFIRHLQRLDSVVVTHLGEDNIFGLKSLLENKLMREKWQSFKAPQIGYLFCNDQFSQPTKEEPQSEFKSLLDVATLSLTGLNGQFFNSLNQLQIEPLACIRNIDSINCTSLPTTGPASRPGKSDKPVPVTLYHKVGHGTLYMYTLNPTLEGITKPQAAANASDEPAATIPEADQQSICTLLIWRPHDLAEKIARILIPGNCTQSDILEGFESLLAMSRVSTRVSRYAPKPKSDGETSIEMAELDILLGHPYPCTGDNIEALLKSRQEEKAVKFRTTPGSLHGYRRSASVAPKVISTRQQQQQAKQSKQQMHPRNRSTTPSRFSRFRSVSPTLRIGQDKKKVDKGAIGASSTTSSVTVHSRQPRAAPPSRASSRARDETSTHSNTVNANVASRQLKSISRPPSSASSGDRAAHRPIASKGQTATGDNIGAKKTPPAPKAAPRTSSVSKRQPLPPISKAEAAPSAKTTAISAQSSGKVFKSPKEFRKSVEASKSVAAPLSATAAPTKTTESGTNEARAVPRKVKRPEPAASVKTESKNEDQSKEEDKVLETVAPVTVSLAGVAAGAAVALAVSATEPELKTDESADAPTMPRNETFDKDLDKLTVENRDLMYEADSEDVSLRSATDEEVNKITQLIAEREKAEADGRAVGDIFPKSPSPPVDSQATEIEGIDADDVTSIRTVTPDVEESKDEVHLDTAADTEHDISIAIDDSSKAVDEEVKVEEAKPDIVQVAVKGVDGYETDYEQLDSLASVDLESEMKVVAPPPSNPFQPEVETDLAIGQANSNQLQKAVEIASEKINEEAVIKKKEAEVSAVEDKSIENKESTDAKEETAQMSATLVAETQQPKLDPPTQLTSSTSDQNLGLDVSNELEMSTSISNVDLMQPSMNDAHMGTATLATDDNKDNEPIVANSEENEILKESNDSLSKVESTESHEQPSIDDSIIRGEAEESLLDTSAKANQVPEKTTDKPTDEAIENESKAMETEVISLKMETTESAPTIDSIIVPSVNLDQTTESQIDTSEMEKSQTIAYDDLTDKKLDVESTSEASIESKPGNATGSNDLFNENLIEGVQTTLTQSPEPESDMACRKTESTTQLKEEISPPIADNNLPENTLEIDESTSEKAVESKIEATESALVSNAPTDLLHTTEAIQPPEPEFDQKTDTTEIDSKLETLQVIEDNILVESEKQLDIESTSEEPIKSKTDAVESASVSNTFTEASPTTLIQPVDSKTEIESDKLDNIKSDPIESAIEMAKDTAENGASEIPQPKQMEITVASKDQLEKENVVPSVLESKTEAEITTEPQSLEEELTAAAKNENLEQSTVSSELTKRQEILEPSVLPSSTAENIVVSGEKQLEREVDTKVNVPITTETNVAVNSDSASFDKEDQIDAEIGTVDESIKSSPTVQSITTEAIKPEISSSKSDPIATESVSEIGETTNNASLTVDSPETEPQLEEQLVLEPNDDTKTLTVDASVPAVASSEPASNAENVAKMSDNTVSETVPSELAKVPDASKIALSENETDLDGKSIFVEKSTESTSDQPIDSNKSAFTEGHSLEVISTEPATQVKITEIPEDKPADTVLPNDESRASKPELVSQKMEETESAPTSTTAADSPVISLSQSAESTTEQFSENYNSGKETTSGELKAPEIEIETKPSTFTESVPISTITDLPATSLSDSKSESSSEQLLKSTNIDFQLRKDEEQAIAASTLVEAETKPDNESTREEPSKSKIGDNEIGSQKIEATESAPNSNSESDTELLATSLSQAETESTTAQPQHATNIDSQLENDKSQIILDNTGKESGLIENDYTGKEAISGELNAPAIEMETESKKSTITESAPISTAADLPSTSLSQSSESTSKQPEKLTDIDSQLDTDELQSITDSNLAKVEEKRQTTDEASVESEIEATESVAVSKTPTELSQATLAETKPDIESTSEKFASETKPDTESTREEPSESKMSEHEIGSQKTDATESAPISEIENVTELLATSLSQAETESTTAQLQQATNIDSQLENDKSQIILDNTGKEAISGEVKESAIEKEIESKKSTLTESAPISTAGDLLSTSLSQSSESISKQPQSITDNNLAKVDEKRQTRDEILVESEIVETEIGVASKTPTELSQTTLAHSIEPEIQQQAKPTEIINDKETDSILLKNESKVVEPQIELQKIEATESASISAATELPKTSLRQVETESTAEQPQQTENIDLQLEIDEAQALDVVEAENKSVIESAIEKPVESTIEESENAAVSKTFPEESQTTVSQSIKPEIDLITKQTEIDEKQVKSSENMDDKHDDLLATSLSQSETESTAEQPQQAKNIDSELQNDKSQIILDNNLLVSETTLDNESTREEPSESKIVSTESADFAHDSLAQSTERGKPQQGESTEVIDAQLSDTNLLNDEISAVESEIVPQKIESTESSPVVSTVELSATSLSQSESQLTQQQSEIETKTDNEKSPTIADSTLLDIKPKPDIDATNEKAVKSKIEVTQIGATEFNSPADLASQPTMAKTDKSANDQSGKDSKIDTQIEKEEMSDKQNTAETDPETLKQTMEIVSAEKDLKNDVKGESTALSKITTESATISETVLKSEGKEKELEIIQVDDSLPGKEFQITEPTVELTDVKETEMTASTVVKVPSEKAQQAEEIIEADKTVVAQKTSENEVPIKSETKVIQDNEAIATVELTQIASSTAENIPEAEETVETCDVKRGDAQPTTAIQEEGDTEVPGKETDDAQVHTGDQAQKPTAPAVDDVKVDSVTAPLEEVNNLESDTHEMTNEKQLGPSSVSVDEKRAEIKTSEDANTIETSSSTVTDLECKEEPTEEITVSLQPPPVSDTVETEIKQKTETGDYFDKIAQEKTKVGETVEQEEPFVAELKPKITNEHVETLEAITPVALSEPDYFDRVMTEKNLSTQEVIESEKTSDEEKTTGESIAEFDVKAAHPTTEAVTLSLHEPIEDAIRDDNDKQTTLEKSSDELNEPAIEMETESKKSTITESVPISIAADLPSTSLSQSSESTSKQPEKLKDIASQWDKDELQSITDSNLAKVDEKPQTTDEMSIESEIEETESVAVSKTPTELLQATLAHSIEPEIQQEAKPTETINDKETNSIFIKEETEMVSSKAEETESVAVSKTPTELLQTTLAHSIEPEIQQEAKPTETINDKETNSIFLKEENVETEMVSSKTETTETASISAATELLETSLGQAETESTAEHPQQPIKVEIANESVTSISDNKDEPVIKSAPELVRDEGALDKVVDNIAIENDKEAKHLSTTEKVIASTLDDVTQSNLEQSSGQIADQATKQEAPEKDDSKPEKQIDSELTANVSNVDSETKSPSASSESELIPEEAANSIESVPCEIVETPESSPEQTLPDSPSDGLDRKLRSPFEIIDELDPDAALYSKPQLGESPIILSPASPSTETLPEHSDRLEITEITSPPESRRQTYRRSDSEFDRKFLQLGLGDRDRLTDSSIKEVTSSSEAISKPSLAKRSDSQFDAAFIQSKDITGEPEVDEPASEASLDNYASNKLENYFTSELVKPLETKVNEMNLDDVTTGFEIVNTSGQVMDENENLLQELQAESKAMLKEAILEEVNSLQIVEDIEIANLEPIVTEIRQLQVEEPVRESVPQIEEGLLTQASLLAASQSEDLSLASETTLTSLSSQLASSIDKTDSTLESLVRDSASVPSLDTDRKSLNASLTEVVSVSDFLLKESMHPPEDEGFQSKQESITLDSFDSTFSQDTIIERHLSVTEDSSLPSSTEESIVQSKPEKEPSDSMLTDSKKTDNTSQLEMASIEKDTDIVNKESQTKEDKSFDNLTESQTISADNPDNAQSEQAAELFAKPKSPSELPSLPVKSDESKQSIDSITVKEIVTESEAKLVTTTEISNGNSVIIENVQPNEMGFSVSSTEQTNSQTLKQPDNTSEELIEIVEVPETTSKRTTEVETLPIKEPTSRSETQPKSEPIGPLADEGEAKETPNLEIKTSLTQDILPQSEIANSVAQVSDSSAVPNQAGESLIVSIGNETSISSQSISRSDKDGNIKLDLEADKKTDIKDSIEPSVSLIEDNFSLEGTAAAAADKLEKLQTDDMVLSVETNVEQVSDQINTQMDSFLITHPDSESAPISSVDKASSEESVEPKLKEEHDPLLAPSTVDLNKLLGIGDGESDEETTAAKSTEVVVDAKVDSLETVQLIQEDKLQEDTASSLATGITRHSMSVEEATPLDISKSPYSSDAFEENEQSVLPDLQPKTAVNLSEDIKQDSTTTLASPELPSEVNIPSEVLSISVNQSMEPKDIKLDCDYEEENTSVTTSATESAQFEKKLDHNTLNEQTIPASDILQKSTETVTEQIKTGNLQTDNKPEKMTETEDTSTKNKDNEPENIQQTPTLKQAESVEASPIITPLDSKPSSSVLESTTSMITTTTTTSGPETSRVSESSSLSIALPEPYEIATAVIEMVNERVKELQQSEVSSSHLAQMATTLELTKTEGKRKDSKQDELNIIAQIKSQSIDLEDLRDNLIETSQTNLAAIPSTITKLDSNQTDKKISESTKMVESEINSKIETFKDSTILNNKAAPLSESLISSSQSSSFGGIEDYGVGHLETANYNSRFDTNVPVENIAYSTSYKQTHSGDAQLPGEMQRNESIERSLSAEKYRVSDNEQDDLDMFQEHSSSIVEQVTKQYEFTPLTAEMVHLSESEPEIEVTLHEPEEFQYSSTILSSVGKPSEGSNSVSVTSQPITDPTDISLQDFITQTANVVVQLSPGKENVEQVFQIGEPIKEQSVTDTVSLTSSKSSTFEGAPTETSTLPTGLISASTQEVTTADQIDRFTAKLTAFPEQHVTEMRTVLERDLVESKQLIEKSETQTMVSEATANLEERVLQEGKSVPELLSSTLTITTFSATPTVQSTAVDSEPLSLPTSSVAALSESFSTSSSSYYKEPLMSSSLHRVTDVAYLSGHMDESSSSSTSSIETSSDEDDGNMFQFSPRTGTITRTTLSPTGPGSNLLTSTTSAHIGNGQTTTSTMSFVLNSNATSNGTAGNGPNGSSQSNGAPASQPFDVDREWGRPLSLPTPQPPMTSNQNAAKLPPLPPQSRMRNRSIDRSGRTEPPSQRPTENGHAASLGPQSRIHPVYVELAYVPGHGKRGYCDEQYFRKIRARYYVFSGVTPSREVFDALLSAKATWEQNLYVTLIPTYESESLCSWIADNQTRLTELRIDVTPAANRCSINLADNGTPVTGNNETGASEKGLTQESCAAYKVEL